MERVDGEGFPLSPFSLSVVLPKHLFNTCLGNPSDCVRKSHHQITLTSLSLRNRFIIHSEMLCAGQGVQQNGGGDSGTLLQGSFWEHQLDYKLNPTWLVAQGRSWQGSQLDI